MFEKNKSGIPQNKSSPAIGWFAARLFLGLVFGYAGFSKLIEPVENFRGAIAGYQIIPYGWTAFIAAGMPWLEFIFGVFMILGYAPRLSALILFFLSFGFLVVLGASRALLDPMAKDCGCFGERGLIHLTVRQVFVLDSVNLLAALKLFLRKDDPWSMDAWLRKS